jgi:hypothetical protein
MYDKTGIKVLFHKKCELNNRENEELNHLLEKHTVEGGEMCCKNSITGWKEASHVAMDCLRLVCKLYCIDINHSKKQTSIDSLTDCCAHNF